MKRKKITGRLLICLCVILIISACGGCGNKKKVKYGDKKGKATGTVDFTGSDAKIDIDNILAPLGADIDYTSLLNIVKGDGDYGVEVNASAVKLDKEGTYNVQYKFTYGDDTYTDNVKVTITDDGTDSTEAQSEQAQTTSPSSETEAGERELITDPNSPGWTDSDIPNAVIELLSGDYVTISCTTSKYIVTTRTDTNEITRDGSKYRVSKLVVIFNTGAEQILETIEKKID